MSRKFFYKMLLVFCIALTCFGLHNASAQIESAPPYQGAINESVVIPVSYKKRNYKITGQTLRDSLQGGGGGMGIDSTTVLELIDTYDKYLSNTDMIIPDGVNRDITLGNSSGLNFFGPMGLFKFSSAAISLEHYIRAEFGAPGVLVSTVKSSLELDDSYDPGLVRIADRIAERAVELGVNSSHADSSNVEIQFPRVSGSLALEYILQPVTVTDNATSTVTVDLSAYLLDNDNYSVLLTPRNANAAEQVCYVSVKTPTEVAFAFLAPLDDQETYLFDLTIQHK